MSGEYTPTTTDVIYAYRVAGTIHPAEYPGRALQGLGHQAEFDRWLAAHDREVRREHAEKIEEAIVRAADTAPFRGVDEHFGWMRGLEEAERITRELPTDD